MGFDLRLKRNEIAPDIHLDMFSVFRHICAWARVYVWASRYMRTQSYLSHITRIRWLWPSSELLTRGDPLLSRSFVHQRFTLGS
jgi:hypothetical protein